VKPLCGGRDHDGGDLTFLFLDIGGGSFDCSAA